MDSITHLALGACLGEVLAGNKLKKKALVWGALAQSAPDIDFISSFWMDIPSALLAHRGFTHSFLFWILATLLFSLAAEKIHRPHNIALKKWILFFGVNIFIHILLDAFNNYGVGWFEPFSHARISFNTLYVADPFFSLWPIIACFMLIILKTAKPGRKKWALFGLCFSGLYLTYSIANKTIVDADVKAKLSKQQVEYSRYFTTPAPFQTWLWFVVAGTDSGYNVGFRSVFDGNKDIQFHFFPRNDSLLRRINQNEDLVKLSRFSKGFYTIENGADGLVFNDLRFGQVIGWQNPHGKFVFHYFLQQPENNKLVVQRGRFKDWNFTALKNLLSRSVGKE